MAARLKIIILAQGPPPDAPSRAVYFYALWADVPAARQIRYADATKTSQWKNATAADVQALQQGQVVESVDSINVPPGQTNAQVQAALVQRWQEYQAYITNYNPWQRTDSTWDGTAWTFTNNG